MDYLKEDKIEVENPQKPAFKLISDYFNNHIVNSWWKRSSV